MPNFTDPSHLRALVAARYVIVNRARDLLENRKDEFTFNSLLIGDDYFTKRLAQAVFVLPEDVSNAAPIVGALFTELFEAICCCYKECWRHERRITKTLFNKYEREVLPRLETTATFYNAPNRMAVKKKDAENRDAFARFQARERPDPIDGDWESYFAEYHALVGRAASVNLMMAEHLAKVESYSDGKWNLRLTAGGLVVAVMVALVGWMEALREPTLRLLGAGDVGAVSDASESAAGSGAGTVIRATCQCTLPIQRTAQPSGGGQ